MMTNNYNLRDRQTEPAGQTNRETETGTERDKDRQADREQSERNHNRPRLYKISTWKNKQQKTDMVKWGFKTYQAVP